MADNFFSRMKGLLGTRELPEGEGLLLKPCNSIHMFGMKYAIDAIFLSRDLEVVGLVESIQPGKISGYFKRAYMCLELPAGTIAKTGSQIGDRLDSLEGVG